MAQIALAWILSKDGVSAPIVGTTSLDNLFDLLSMDIPTPQMTDFADGDPPFQRPSS